MGQDRKLHQSFMRKEPRKKMQENIVISERKESARGGKRKKRRKKEENHHLIGPAFPREAVPVLDFTFIMVKNI